MYCYLPHNALVIIDALFMDDSNCVNEAVLSNKFWNKKICRWFRSQFHILIHKLCVKTTFVTKVVQSKHQIIM